MALNLDGLAFQLEMRATILMNSFEHARFARRKQRPYLVRELGGPGRDRIDDPPGKPDF